MAQTPMSPEEIAERIQQCDIVSGWIDAKKGLQTNYSHVDRQFYTGVINTETGEIIWYDVLECNLTV